MPPSSRISRLKRRTPLMQAIRVDVMSIEWDADSLELGCASRGGRANGTSTSSFIARVTDRSIHGKRHHILRSSKAGASASRRRAGMGAVWQWRLPGRAESPTRCAPAEMRMIPTCRCHRSHFAFEMPLRARCTLSFPKVLYTSTPSNPKFSTCREICKPTN
jgi:hypothetical protein